MRFLGIMPKSLVLFLAMLLLITHLLPIGAESDPAIHTTEADFSQGDNQGGFIITHHQDGELTLAPRAVRITSWAELELTPLPQRLARHGMVAAQGQLFVLGGVSDDGTVQSTVYRAHLEAAGSLDGWQQIASLPTPLADHVVVVANEYLFILGGWDGQHNTSAVYSASLEEGGQLGDWVPLTPLPIALAEHTAVVISGHLFVIGGQDGNGVAQTAVYRAAINADGSLGSWTEMLALPQPLHSHAAVVAGSCLFLTGGYNGSTGVSIVYKTTITINNSVAEWVELGNTRLPTGRSDHSAVASHDQIFVIGGIGETGYDEETVLQATIEAGCTLGPWQELTQTPLPDGVFDHASTAIQGHIFVTGGHNINLSKYDAVYQTKVIPNGTLGVWYELTASPLPIPLSAHSVAFTQDHLFATGGRSVTGVLSSTYSARVVSDGALSGWSEALPLPHPLYEHASVIVNGRLLTVGGHDGNVERDSLYAADIHQDGTLGNWEMLNCPLPQPLYGHAAVMASPYLYVMGGRRGYNEQDTVYKIALEPDCAQQVWQQQVSLPQPMWHHAAAVVGDYLFVSGGVSQNGGVVLDIIYRSTIGAEGVLGAWVELTDTPLPEPLHKHAMMAANGYLYVVGGETGAYGERYRIHRTSVSAEGTLEGWKELDATPLPRALYGHVAVNTDMYLFVLGGIHNYEPQAAVYSTTFHRAAVQAAFTHQFDLGNDQDIGILNWQDRGDSDAVLSVRYRIAPDSTAEYGPWSEAYTASPLPIYDHGRYLQYQLLVENPNGGVKAVDEVSLTYGDVGDYVKAVDESGAGIPDAEVYLNGQPVGTTGVRGVLPPEALPQGLHPSDRLAVLSLITQTSTIRQAHTTPDSNGANWAYRTYLTNLEVITTGHVLPYTVTHSGGQVIRLSRDRPLVLYSLLVSIEWDATVTYTRQISGAIRLASDYLYDLSEGQMALGYVTIYDNATYWGDADLQISTKNTVHPHAYVGGLTATDKSHVIRVGRYWDGQTGNQGPWDEQDGYRTLIHEFGHYALYLYDEYFAYVFDQGGNLAREVPAYCTGPENRNPATDATNASVMDYQYTTSELGMRGVPGLWSDLCEQTAQWQLNGESDWETVVRRYADPLGPPRWQFTTPADRGSVVAGPTGVPSATLPFPLVEVHNSGPSAPTRTLTVYGPQGPCEGALVALYTNQGGHPVAIDQGFTDWRGEIDIYGAQAGDTLRAASFDGALSGSVSVTDAATYTIVMAPVASLQALAIPGLNPYLTLRPSSDGDTLYLRLCGLGPGGTLVAIVTQSGGGDSQTTALAYSGAEEAYVGSVTFAPHVRHGTGTAQVIGAGVGSQGISLNSTYALQAIPRDRLADLYSADGNLQVHLITGTLPFDAYAVLSPLSAAPIQPPAGLQIVGNVYDVKLSGLLDVAPASQPFALSLHYDPEILKGDFIGPGTLRIYRWEPDPDPHNPTDQARWVALGGSRLEGDNSVSIATDRFGVYALMGFRVAKSVYLPLIMKSQ